MYCNSGTFMHDVTIGGCLYITNHKHMAVYGTKDSVNYGESDYNSYMNGKDVGITANNKFFIDSTNGTHLGSRDYVHIESGFEAPNHNTSTGSGVEIYSQTGGIKIDSKYGSIFTRADYHVHIEGGSGICINNVSYGTSLPTSGIEGQIFFKLIS